MPALNARKWTYLQLCNKLMDLTDEHGYRPRSSIKDFTQDVRLLPQFVESAWNEIARQNHEWKFLREDNFITQPLKAGLNEQYVDDLLGDRSHEFSHWNENGVFRTEQDGIERLYSALVPYEDIRKYSTDSVAPESVDYFALMPNDNIYVWPKPAKGLDLRLRVDFYRRPKTLINDDDTTDLPPGAEMVVVWLALMTYYMNEQDTPGGAFAFNRYKKEMTNLRKTEAPRVSTRVRLY